MIGNRRNALRFSALRYYETNFLVRDTSAPYSGSLQTRPWVPGFRHRSRAIALPRADAWPPVSGVVVALLPNWRAFDVARHRPCRGKSSNNPAREARQTPRSVIRPVTSRAGVTSKA